MEILNFELPQGEAKQRLDHWLSLFLQGQFSRNRLQQLIKQGQVRVDQHPCLDPATKLKAPATISLNIPAAIPAEPEAESIPLDLYYEDDQLLVVNKPAGLVVHPGAGNPKHTLVNGLLHHCAGQLSGIGGVERPGIVHRIDKLTSGLLVVAKTQTAHTHLSEQFAEHSIHRRYQALIWGKPTPAQGRIEGAIARDPTNRKRMAVRKTYALAKPAITDYRLLHYFDKIKVSHVECTLHTGRTHQIRVHMLHLGHPVIGDPIYRVGKAQLNHAKTLGLPLPDRQMLHAAELGFIHPVTHEPMQFKAPLPPDMQGFMEAMVQ